jgi:hypothetical protein
MGHRDGATGAQLRNDIDSGRTGDKVAAPDPAAAPLGTDEEAAGTPTPPELMAMNRRAEDRSHLKATAAERASAEPWGGRGALTVLILVVLIGLTIGYFTFA